MNNEIFANGFRMEKAVDLRYFVAMCLLAYKSDE